MKLKKIVLLSFAIFNLITSISAHAGVTNMDWGGYVPTSDSPVIGGAIEITYCAANSGYPNYTCSSYYTSIRGFGLIAYTGTMTYGVVVGNGTNRYKGISTACPVNSAKIDMPSGYVRADTNVKWDGLYDPNAPGSYSSGGWMYLGGSNWGVSNGLNSFVCVKTDTY